MVFFLSTNKILSIGSYNVGLTCRTKRMPAWGETIVGQGFIESYGGKGSNQAVAAKKLGAEVEFIGCIGKDGFGNNGLEMLKRNGINVDNVTRSDTNTGIGIILLNEQNDNAIILDLGANFELTESDLEKSEESIKNSDIILFQMEIPHNTIKRGMELAKKHDKTIIFNPAPASEESKDLIKYANIINPNESELLILNDLETDTKLDDEETIRLANNLLNKGPEVVIVTRGEKPTLLVTQDGSKFIKTESVQAVDTTGAGDTFTGALAVSLGEGNTIEESINFANAAGAYVVQRDGVVPAIPNRDELTEFLNND